MATLNAFRNLGRSIVADITDAKNAIASNIDRARSERKVVADFKSLLREHPASVAQAFATLAEPKPRTRKPRVAK